MNTSERLELCRKEWVATAFQRKRSKDSGFHAVNKCKFVLLDLKITGYGCTSEFWWLVGYELIVCCLSEAVFQSRHFIVTLKIICTHGNEC